MPDFSPASAPADRKYKIMHNVVALVSDDVHSAMIKSMYIPVLESAGLGEVRPSIEYVHGLPVQKGEGYTYFQNYGLRLRYAFNHSAQEQPHYICITSPMLQEFMDNGFVPEYILAVLTTSPSNSPGISRIFGEAMMALKTDNGFMLDGSDPSKIYQAYIWISTIARDIERKQNEPQRKV